jgi:4-amino-4-deoxy-L-arabinose transferase-like glycosyltransferase
MFDRWNARLALIVLAAAGLYLVGNDRVGLWDRDEPRYAQTSKQMLLSGDWVVPRLLGNVRTAKPALIYWCQAGAMWMIGRPSPFAARLPSVLAMVLTLAILGAVLRKYIGPRRAAWTVLILATSGLAIGAAKMCITDSVLLLWITIAQLCLFAVYRGNRSWMVTIVMWAAIGLGGLTKGPVVLGVLFMTMLALLAFDLGKHWRTSPAWKDAIRWWPRTRPLVGILIIAAVATPWLVMIERRSPGFLKRSIGHELFDRTVKPLEGHKGPPGYYLLTVWGTYLPWSLLLPTTMTLAWKHRRLQAIRFALAAIIGPWVMFEIFQTKLAHYVLPTFPALAFLTADAIVRCMRGQHDDLRRPIAVVATGIWAGAIIVIGLAPWLATLYFRPMPPALYAAMIGISIVAIIYALSVFVLFRRRRFVPAFVGMAMGMMAMVAAYYALYLPKAQFLWLPQRIADRLVREDATRPDDVVMIDYKEDSLPFYQGGTIRSGESLLHVADPARWPTWVVITRKAWGTAPAPVKAAFDEVESFKGCNYAGGKVIVEVLIVRKHTPAAG